MLKKTVFWLWGFVFILIGTLVLFYLKSIYINSTQLSTANQSVFSFSDSDFNSHRVLKLHGEVEFYYDTLLYPLDFKRESVITPTGLARIPGKWNNFKLNGENIKGHGKATYHFKIKVPIKGGYGFKIKEFKSAYALWVNGDYVGGTGVVATNKKNMRPSRLRKEYYFITDTNIIDVIIQCSNFHHYKGGATDTIIFGKTQSLIEYKNLQIGIEVFIFGILFILFIYHLTLYAYRKTDRSILYFSLLCLTMLLRLGYTSEKILIDIASFIPWEFAIRIEYISFIGIPIFTLMFLRKLFPIEVTPFFVKFVVYPCILMIAIVIFTPPTIFSYVPYFLIYFLAVSASYVSIVLFKAVLNRRDYSISIFIGYLVFFAMSLNDALYYKNLIDSALLMPIGLLIVTFSQAYVLASKISSAYSKIENLSNELSNHANRLEVIVEQRTKEVFSQKDKIESQKDKLQEKAAELESKNEELILLAGFKQDMTNMMIHDLKTPLSNIIGFTSLPGGSDKYRDLIHASGWEMQNLIQNILDVEKYDSTKLKVKISKVEIHKLVSKAYDAASFMIYRNRIKFINNIPTTVEASIDEELIQRVFENLFSNATKYGNDDGVIEVSSTHKMINNRAFCRINIYNSGEPIPSEKIDSVFQKYTQLGQSSESLTYSTGIGLTFCRMAIEAHGGIIGANSGKEKGVSFWFTLPC